MGKYRVYSSREQAFNAGLELFGMMTTGTVWDDPKTSVACVDTVAGGILAVAPGHPEMFGAGGITNEDKVIDNPEAFRAKLQECCEAGPPPAATDGKFGAIDPKWMDRLKFVLQMLLALMSK